MLTNYDSFSVFEGNTGILYLSNGKGEKETFIPNYDLKKVKKLLKEFYKINDEYGTSIKNNYFYSGYNWFPCMVSKLYWHYFFGFIKYKKIIEKINPQSDIKFLNEGNFKLLYDLFLYDKVPKSTIKNWILFKLICFNNWLTLKVNNPDLLFFRFNKIDFRSIEIRKILANMDLNYLELLPPDRIKNVIFNIIYLKPVYYFKNNNKSNFLKNNYSFKNMNDLKKTFFKKCIKNIEIEICGLIKEFKTHYRLFSKKNIKIFYGFDDCNEYVFPLIYACRANKIITIAHQHGAYVKAHEGYILDGFTQNDYTWFDKIIVWGEYWKNQLLDNSNVYNDKMFIIGSNKLPQDYSRSGKIKRSDKMKNILIPYEFTSNTYKIGQYMIKLIELGYKIYFKPRPDENINAQIKSYCLPEHLSKKISIIKKINKEIMQDIDIIAGTMTTLIYELLPFNKIIWIFDIEYNHLQDLVDQGYAYKIRFNELSDLNTKKFKETKIDKDYFFSSNSLEKILNETFKKFIG